MQDIFSPDLAAEILEQPLFADLEPEGRARLLAALDRESLDEGTIINEEGQQPDRVCFLVRGEVAATQGGDLVRMFHAPAELGLLSMVDGRPFTATMTAFTRVEIMLLSKAVIEELTERSPAFRRNLIDYFASEVRALHEKNEALRRSLDDFFESPNARVVPGPYVADPFDMYFFVMEADPRRTRAVLPEGLKPIPGLGGHYLLTFSFFDRVHSQHPSGLGKVFSYNETTLFVPCLGPNHRPSVFAPELYPDSYLAITIGRELYGFPKRFGQTDRLDRSINLVLNRRLALRATWKDESPIRIGEFISDSLRALGGESSVLAPLAQAAGGIVESTNRDSARNLWPSVPVFVHRQVPDTKRHEPTALATDELLEVPFRITSLASFERLQRPEVRFLDESHFLGGKSVAGFRYRIGFEFGRSKHWASYQAEDADQAGLANRFRGWWRGA